MDVQTMKKILACFLLAILSINIAYAGDHGTECPSVWIIIQNSKIPEFKINYISANMHTASSSDIYDTSYTWHFDIMIPGWFNSDEARQQAAINIGTLQFISGPEILPDKNKWCFYQTNIGKAYAHRTVQRS